MVVDMVVRLLVCRATPMWSAMLQPTWAMHMGRHQRTGADLPHIQRRLHQTGPSRLPVLAVQHVVCMLYRVLKVAQPLAAINLTFCTASSRYKMVFGCCGSTQPQCLGPTAQVFDCLVTHWSH